MADLRGRGLAITGAFGALGTATALAAMRAGATVALIDKAPAPPSHVVEACSKNACLLPGIDLTDFTEATNVMNAASVQMRCFDGLVNIAGAFRWQAFSDAKLQIWDELFAVNVKTAVNACAAALPYLRGAQHGRIINVGANSALKASVGMGPYAAAKSGVHRLTESLAEELKATGITVNAVLPSIIDTPANRRDMPDADFSAWVAPDALAEIILFLASSEAQAITGALVPVTGRV